MKNKKRFTKLAALALAATMLTGSASAVSAHELTNNDVSLLHGALCPDCNYGEMRPHTEPWTFAGFGVRECTHHAYGTDTVRVEEQKYGSKCNHCGAFLRSGVNRRVSFYKCDGHD